MTLEEYHESLIQTVTADGMLSGIGPHACFIEEVASLMIDAEILPEEITEVYYEGYGKRNRKVRINGYYEDVADGSMSLFWVDYDEELRRFTKTEAMQGFHQLQYFIEEALYSDLYAEVEPSTPVSDLIDRLRVLMSKGEITKYKFYILTNAKKSNNIKSFDEMNINGVPIECILWDLERIYNLVVTNIKEPIEIDFKDYTFEGIPSLEASAAFTDDYKSYLCIIPGDVLADIYDTYGSRLLEGNVRSFLSAKRAVNKKIRSTILNEPTRFFAYNNGIAATAMDLTFESRNSGLYLIEAKDFQIINGGQTTASLSNTRFKDKADLEDIYVQMKITQIGKMSRDAADELVHQISRYSNSQNKVSEADFFATSPFHIEMERFSRRIWAPAQNGSQIETKWFYERARGQYDQEQMRMTKAKQKQFQQKNPKNQRIQKTDLAKYRFSWEEHPNIVSRGAQTNFTEFAKVITDKWESNKDQFNELYFKESIALAILFKTLESIVSHASWYGNSYRANVVTYTIALFHYLLKKQFKSKDFDLMQIWNKQSISIKLQPILDRIAHAVYEYITDEGRPITNVTQWCKQEACWNGMKKNINIDLPSNIMCDFIQDKEDIRSNRKTASEVQKIDSDLEVQKRVINLGIKWDQIATDAKHYSVILNDKEARALKMALKIQYGKIPQPFQCQMLLKILDRLKEEGKVY